MGFENDEIRSRERICLIVLDDYEAAWIEFRGCEVGTIYTICVGGAVLFIDFDNFNGCRSIVLLLIGMMLHLFRFLCNIKVQKLDNPERIVADY